VAMQMIAGGALQLCAGLALGESTRLNFAQITPTSAWAFVYLTLIGSLVGFTAYVWLLQVSTPARVSTYAYVNPPHRRFPWPPGPEGGGPQDCRSRWRTHPCRRHPHYPLREQIARPASGLGFRRVRGLPPCRSVGTVVTRSSPSQRFAGPGHELWATAHSQTNSAILNARRPRATRRRP
jgi:hypothetical protein